MRCSKRGSMEEVRNNTGLLQGTRKLPDQQSNLKPKRTRKRRTNEAQN